MLIHASKYQGISSSYSVNDTTTYFVFSLQPRPVLPPGQRLRHLRGLEGILLGPQERGVEALLQNMLMQGGDIEPNVRG